MKTTRALFSTLLALVIALLLVPASALASPENTWTSETVGTSIDFDTLSVSEGEFFAGETVHVSLECVSDDVTRIEMRFNNYSSGGEFFVTLLDPEGDGTFEGDITVQDSMYGTYEAREVHVYASDKLIAQIASDTLGGAYQLYADFHNAGFTVAYTDRSTAVPCVDTLSGTISQTTAKPGDVITISFAASSPNGMSTSSSYLSVVFDRDYDSGNYDSAGIFYNLKTRLEDPDGDGIFVGTLDLTGMKPGSWALDSVVAHDDAGKSKEYYVDGIYFTRMCPEFAALNFTIVDPGEGAETNPPVIDPSSFELICDRNPMTRGDTIILRTRVTDDTQVARVEAQISMVYDTYLSSYGRVTFEDKGDGIWEATVPLFWDYPENYSGSECYTVEAIAAYDVYGNRKGVCQEKSYYGQYESYGPYEVVDMSPFNFKVVQYLEEPEFQLDPASIVATPNPVEVGSKVNVALNVEANKLLWYAEVTFTNGTNDFSLDTYDNSVPGDFTGKGTVPSTMPLGTYHVKSIKVVANDRSTQTFVQEGSGLEGIECDFSATEVELVEATTVHTLLPDFSTLTVTPKEAKPGDTVTIKLRFTGDAGFNPWRPRIFTICQGQAWQQPEVRLYGIGDGWYSGTYQVTNDTPAGLWQGFSLQYWDEFDTQYLYYDHDFSSASSVHLDGADFTVVKSGGEGEEPIPDTEPPVFIPEKSGAWPKNADASSQFRIQVAAEDVSGFAYRGCTIHYGNRSYGILRESSTGYFATTSASNFSTGEYVATYLELTDSVGNKVYVVDPNWSGAETFGLTPKVYEDLSMLNFTKVNAGTSLNGAKMTVDETPVYDGTPQKPAVTLTLNGEALVEGRDYELGWQDNIDAGTAYVWAMGVGDYVGAARRSFNVLPASLTSAQVDPIPDQAYDGGIGPKPDVRVTLGGVELVRGRDYEVRYSGNQVVGTATAHIYGMGNYQGTITAPFEVLPLDISNGEVTLPDEVVDAEGLENADASVVVEGKELVARKDFTVAVEQDPVAGVAKVIISGVRACTGTIERELPLVTTRVPMFRLYNQWTYEHFYTADEAERDKLVSVGWTDEGVGWWAPLEGDPVYRLYNQYASGGDHHYTMDKAEYDYLVSVGWTGEGIGWYSDPAQTVPVYREYNPYEQAHNHNYTPDKAEHDNLVSLGWHDEGIGWYGVEPLQ